MEHKGERGGGNVPVPSTGKGNIGVHTPSTVGPARAEQNHHRGAGQGETELELSPSQEEVQATEGRGAVGDQAQGLAV